MPKLSVVIPCYCSELFLENTVQEVVGTLEMLEGFEYELILVNDASPDSTYSIIEKCASDNKRIIGADLTRNFGQHAALLAGYRIATGDYIISMDDDGQTPAAGIPVLLEELFKGYDTVFANYPVVKQTAFRKFGSKVNQKMMEWLLEKPKTITTTSFFIFNRLVCDEINKATTPYPYIAGLIFRITRRISSVDVMQNERKAGKSGYSLRKLISLWLNGFTSFSVKPMRFASIVGTIVSIFGFVGIILVLVNKLMHPEAPLGYSSTMVAMLLLGGTILLFLGMIGEYIGRVFVSINNPPQYAIRNTTLKSSSDSSEDNADKNAKNH